MLTNTQYLNTIDKMSIDERALAVITWYLQRVKVDTTKMGKEHMPKTEYWHRIAMKTEKPVVEWLRRFLRQFIDRCNNDPAVAPDPTKGECDEEIYQSFDPAQVTFPGGEKHPYVANITPLFDSWRKFNTNRGTELRSTALSDLKQSLIAYGVTTRSLSGRTLYVFDSRAITARLPKQRSTESFVLAISHPIQLDFIPFKKSDPQSGSFRCSVCFRCPWTNPGTGTGPTGNSCNPRRAPL
jgi:hypothetical protein